MLGGSKHKQAPSLKSVKKVEDDSTNVELPRPLFRGFLGGDVFITKKGFRGLKLDSLWVQNIFESYKNDDAELATIALQSSLADVNDRVIGGIYGSPFSIGDYGFFAEAQFKPQYEYLNDKIHDIAITSKMYLSTDEWNRIEKRLLFISNYGNFNFLETIIGDSFADLAIRSNSFQVARICMNNGIDPLIENSIQDDLFTTMKKQYHKISLQLREIQNLKDEASRKVVVPSVVQHILAEECRLLDCYYYLSEFANELKMNLLNRIKNIELDIVLQRRALLRNEAFPESKVWNIAQQDKAERYLKEIEELKAYILEKISYHENGAIGFRSVSTLLRANKKLLDTVGRVRGGDTAVREGGGSEVNSVVSPVEDTVVTSMYTSDTTVRSDTKSSSLIQTTTEESAARSSMYYIDDTSILTEEGQPSRIPKLPHIPNRLRNALIDGKNKNYRKKNKKNALALDLVENPKDSQPGEDSVSPLRWISPIRSPTPSRPGSRTGTPLASARGDGFTPRPRLTTGREFYDAYLTKQAAIEAATGDQAATTGTGSATGSQRPGSTLASARSTPKTSGRPFPFGSSSHSPSQHSISPSQHSISPSRGGANSLWSPTASGMWSSHSGSSTSGMGSRGWVATPTLTPSQKIRQGQQLSGDQPEPSSTEDLYALIGVIQEEDRTSIGSAGSGGGTRQRGIGRPVATANTGIIESSAKVLAKAMKEQYASVLGTLKETENAVIMYR